MSEWSAKRWIAGFLLGMLLALPAWAEDEQEAPTADEQPPAATEGDTAQPPATGEAAEEAPAEAANPETDVLTFDGKVRPPIPELSEEDIAELKKGEVITRTIIYRDSNGEKAASAQAIALIDLPGPQAFAPAYDYEHFADFLPRTEQCHLVRKVDKNLWIAHYWIDASLMTVEYELQLNHSFVNNWVEWRMNPEFEDPDIKDTTGYWAVYPWQEDPSQSLMVYVVRLDTGRSWVPDFIVDYLTKSGLPDVVSNARNRALSGGTWKIGDPPVKK